jgi:integrase/recombinase XerC
VGREPRKRRHRPHKPAELGPRTFTRGRWQWVDLRPFGGERQPIRNPKHPNWPDAGDRTTDPETARRWAWAYLDHLRVDAKQRHLGLRGPAKPLGSEALRYLAHVERAKATKTYLNAHAAIAVHLVPFFGETTPVDTIDSEALQGWIDQLADKGYAIGTLTQYLSNAGAFFRWRSKGTHTPTRDVELPDPGERDVQPWTDVELAKLRKAADALDKTADSGPGPRAVIRSYRRLLELGLATGCRAAELGALEWSAFNADERTIRVRWQLPVDGYGTTLQPLKGRRNRTALVLPFWWAYHDAAATGLVLAEPNAGRISQKVMYLACRRLIEKAGLKRDRQNVHSLRHTYARLCLEMGARLEELQQFLGHASIRTTESAYGWLTSESATTLARARIYGEQLSIVRPRKGARYGTGRG